LSINTSPDRGGTESSGASFAACYDLVSVGDSLGSALFGTVLAWPQRIEDPSSHFNIETLGLEAPNDQIGRLRFFGVL
jgi:hypothetical protein